MAHVGEKGGLGEIYRLGFILSFYQRQLRSFALGPIDTVPVHDGTTHDRHQLPVVIVSVDGHFDPARASSDRGDTLVELPLAVSLLSLLSSFHPDIITLPLTPVRFTLLLHGAESCLVDVNQSTLTSRIFYP
jgi:hypothetical protein